MPKREERRRFWTWGYQSDEPSEESRQLAARQMSARLGTDVRPPSIPHIDDIEIRTPRLTIQEKLCHFVTSDHAERITHTYGGHSTELLAAIRGEFPNPPDAVAHPATEALHELRDKGMAPETEAARAAKRK